MKILKIVQGLLLGAVTQPPGLCNKISHKVEYRNRNFLEYPVPIRDRIYSAIDDNTNNSGSDLTLTMSVGPDSLDNN